MRNFGFRTAIAFGALTIGGTCAAYAHVSDGAGSSHQHLAAQAERGSAQTGSGAGQTSFKMNFTQVAARQTLDRIEDTISAEGDNAQTAQKIGQMLVALVSDPKFEYDSVEPHRSPANDKHPEVNAWVLASHKAGSAILAFPHIFYGPSPKDLIHYHGQWEVITMATGNWQEFLYEPITKDPWEPGVKTVKFSRTLNVRPGEFLVMNPTTPHGTRKGQRRDCYGIMVVYVGAKRSGKRMDLDPVTGKATLAVPEY